jgi:hypothetical protein
MVNDEFAPHLSSAGPYRAVEAAMNSGETSCVACQRREAVADMFMSGGGLLCRQCHHVELLRAQQKRAERGVEGQAPPVGEVLDSLRKMLLAWWEEHHGENPFEPG